MRAKVAEVMDDCIQRLGGGNEATARRRDDARDALLEHAYAVAHRLCSPLRDVNHLTEALLAAYHLGRQQAIERMAIGIDMSVAEAWRQSVDQARSSRAGLDALGD
jgi:hypothetical protein